MASTPDRIVVQIRVRGTDKELLQLLRHAVRTPRPRPQRYGLRARLARWWTGRR